MTQDQNQNFGNSPKLSEYTEAKENKITITKTNKHTQN